MKLFQRIINNYADRRRQIEQNGVFHYIINSSGYVLILVLVTTTLLVTVSAEFLSMTQTHNGFLKKSRNRIQASLLAKSGIQIMKTILYADQKGLGAEMLTGKPANKNTDSFFDIWALEFPEMPMEDGSLKMKIIDENSKINQSVMWNEQSGDITKFYRFTQNLFINLGFTMDFADCICDWVDPNDERMPYGAESPDFYQNQTPPIRAKNFSMDSISELLMVKNITPEIFYGLGGGNFGREHNLVDHNHGDTDIDPDRLSDIPDQVKDKIEKDKEKKGDEKKIGPEKNRSLAEYLTVYGERSDFMSEFNKININTASYRVLSALTENMTDDIVTEIIRRRQVKPFETVEELKDLIQDEKVRGYLSVKSFIFRLISTARVENSLVTINAVYNRGTRKLLYWSEE